MPAEADQLHVALPSPDDMAGKLGYLAGVVGSHGAAIAELRSGLQANVERVHAVETQIGNLGTNLQGEIAKVQDLVRAAHTGIGNLANVVTVSKAQSEKLDAYLDEVRRRQPERDEKDAQREQDMKRLMDRLREQDEDAADRAEDAKERAERLSKLLKGISALLLLALVGLAGQGLSSIHSRYGDAILPWLGMAIVAVVALYLVVQPRITGGA